MQAGPDLFKRYQIHGTVFESAYNRLDQDNRTYGKEGITWQSWYTGMHEDDSAIIIDSLLECVDDFSNEFLEVNPDSD